jgi:hypothetical protein
LGGFVLVSSAAIVLLAFAAARWLRHRARRRALLSAEAARQLDRRPPILFLRAFRDDQVSLAAARLPLLTRLIDPGSIGGSLEELIVQEYTGLGPVVAIGARPIRCCRLVFHACIAAAKLGRRPSMA